jgi:hypothetical protein
MAGIYLSPSAWIRLFFPLQMKLFPVVRGKKKASHCREANVLKVVAVHLNYIAVLDFLH